MATFFIKVKSNRISAALMGISGGIMLAIVLFDMLPESLEAAAWHWTLVFFILGALAALIVNKFLPHYDVPSGHDDSIIQGLKAVSYTHLVPKGVMSIKSSPSETISYSFPSIIIYHPFIYYFLAAGE